MYAEVYKCQFKLARYFQSTKDKWLSDHFFNSCLRTSAGVKDDDGKMAAEGHCNVGLALEENGWYTRVELPQAKMFVRSNSSVPMSFAALRSYHDCIPDLHDWCNIVHCYILCACKAIRHISICDIYHQYA